MQPQNTGSFGVATGGVEALRAAMQRRGIDTSVLDTISASAPTGPSQVAPAVTQQAPNVMNQTAAQAVTPAAKAEVPFRSGEMEISLRALRDTVKTENKIAEAALGLQ